MPSLLRVLLSSTAALLVLSGAALANQVTEILERELRLNLTEMTDARQALEAKPASEWSAAETEHYLSSAMFVLEDASILYLKKYGQLPHSGADLVDAGILSDLPGNAFNNWQPMQLGQNPSFSAGDAFLIPCPPAEYSGIRKPAAWTHVLGVFGASPEYVPLSPTAKLFDWVSIPAGTATLTGYRAQNATQSKARIQKAQEQREQQGLAEGKQ